MSYKPNPKWELTATTTTTVGWAAEYLECDQRQVRRYMKDGRIRIGLVAEGHWSEKALLYKPDVLAMKKARKGNAKKAQRNA